MIINRKRSACLVPKRKKRNIKERNYINQLAFKALLLLLFFSLMQLSFTYPQPKKIKKNSLPLSLTVFYQKLLFFLPLHRRIRRLNRDCNNSKIFSFVKDEIGNGIRNFYRRFDVICRERVLLVRRLSQQIVEFFCH